MDGLRKALETFQKIRDEVEKDHLLRKKASRSISKEELERLNTLLSSPPPANNWIETFVVPKLMMNLPNKLKEWYQSVPVRARVIQKIVEEVLIVIDKKDLTDINDPAFKSVVIYALRNELILYELANTREEYYHSLAEKIYYIRRLERSDRLLCRSTGSVPVVPPGITVDGETGKEWWRPGDSSNFGPFSNVCELEKRRYRQQLVLLLHAYKCQKRDSTNGEVGGECNLAQCPAMRNVLSHIQVCRHDNYACGVPNCSSSKALILHWQNCTQRECALCLPIKEAHERRKQREAADLIGQ